jgi:membrane protein CcdC involved in cytochrome C biogenesis
VTEESPKQRVDRELMELLNELRVALPGVQVLFGFLLTVPFATGFENADAFHRSLLLAAILTAGLAIAFLVAPAAQHRILFRARHKKALLKRANAFAIVGMGMLAISIAVCVLLVVDYLFRLRVASATAAVIAVVLAALWLVQPLLYRGRDQLDDVFGWDEDSGESARR